ncbi:heme o synthase [Candidatus Saccharibacteria bacterium]|nr:heme o synthase [Candidatus Saccharibacteria bacterium]
MRQYYLLTKPGIIRGNLIVALAGFLLASKGSINFSLLLAFLAGTSLIIACGCVINNYIDKDIDIYMSRTKTRALVTGTVSNKNAIIFGIILGILGIALLATYTNFLTLTVGLVGLFFYLVMYSIFKRKNVYGTLVGSVSGAMPPVAGYTAVTNQLDITAGLLFLILVFWQMPHFYSIAMYRLDDYRKADIPVLPAIKGLQVTKRHIIGYIIAFGIACAGLFFSADTGYTYLAAMIAVVIWWIWVGIKGFNSIDNNKWAHGMFGVSLVALLVFSIFISVCAWLP